MKKREEREDPLHTDKRADVVEDCRYGFHWPPLVSQLRHQL